jgi:hypothetical protein
MTGIIIITISCAIILVLVIEIYYKLRKEHQISSPFIHINCILLSVFIGVCYIIELSVRVSKSPDPAARVVPYVLAFPILGCCIVAGILVGLLYWAHDYKLFLGKNKSLKQTE